MQNMTPKEIRDRLGVLSIEQLDELAASIPIIKRWVDQLELYLFKQLESGVVMKHAYLGPKQANRKWSDSCDIIQSLQSRLTEVDVDDFAPRVALTPAKMEGILSKEQFLQVSDLIVKESAGLTVKFSPTAITQS